MSGWKHSRYGAGFALLAVLLTFGISARGERRFITLASTTSTDNSGFFAAILPLFEKKTGIAVRVVAVGTGQALSLARKGDADVLLVHDRVAEERFVAEGWGVARFDVMYNDFVLVGPEADPASVRGGRDALTALRSIATHESAFVSRGDRSGTHKAELRLWKAAVIDPVQASGTWYRETGSGMGATLNTAVAMEAYTLADRATWSTFKNHGSLEIVLEGDERLFNPYGVILVNPERHPHVKEEEGRAFIEWLLSSEGQAATGSFRKQGQVLFHPNAAHPKRR